MATIGYDGTSWSYAKPSTKRSLPRVGWDGEGWSYARKPGSVGRPSGFNFADRVGLEAPGFINTTAISNRFAKQLADAGRSVPSADAGRSMTGGDTFRADTSTEIVARRNRRLSEIALGLARQQAGIDREAAEAAYANTVNRLKRGGYRQMLAAREGLSGTGRGFSPRFVLGAQQDINAATASDIASAAALKRSRINDIARSLADATTSSIQNLSSDELDRLTSASGGVNLDRINAGTLSGMFRSQ